MCLTYIETYHRLCAKSVIVNYSLVEFFFNGKNILLFLGLFVLIFYSGKGGGVFSLFKQSVGFLFYLFIDFFSPFRSERSFDKINYENEWGITWCSLHNLSESVFFVVMQLTLFEWDRNR